MEMLFQSTEKGFEDKMLNIFEELQETYTDEQGICTLRDEDVVDVLEIMKCIFSYVKTMSKRYWNTKTLLKHVYHIGKSGEYQYLFAVGRAHGGQKLAINKNNMIMAARWMEYYYRIYEAEYKDKRQNMEVKEMLKEMENLNMPKKKKTEKRKEETVPFPVRLYKYTEQYVIGQPELKKLAMALHRYINLGIREVVLIKGPTGSGKNYATEIMTRFEGMDEQMTVMTWDLSQITPSGFSGANMRDILTAFERACSENGTPPGKGIIILNECDKLMQPNTDSNGENVNAITQQQLLTMLEGKHKEKNVDTSNIMFILLGAFGRVDEMVEERKQKNRFGFGQEEEEIGSSCTKQVNLRNDMIEMGAQRELVGRIGTIIELKKLDKEDIRKIILHPDTGIVHTKQKEFQRADMELEFTDGAIELIVDEIMRENLGARSVSNIVNELVDKYQFDMFECGYSKMIVHEGQILYGESPRFEGGREYGENVCTFS